MTWFVLVVVIAFACDAVASDQRRKREDRLAKAIEKLAEREKER